MLMMKRAQKSSSFASAYVFPGGVEDPVDGVVADGSEPLASKLCAVRELFEETGLLLLPSRLSAVELQAARFEVRTHATAFQGLCARWVSASARIAARCRQPPLPSSAPPSPHHKPCDSIQHTTMFHQGQLLCVACVAQANSRLFWWRWRGVGCVRACARATLGALRHATQLHPRRR